MRSHDKRRDHIEHSYIVKILRFSIDSNLTDLIRQIIEFFSNDQNREKGEMRKMNRHTRTLVLAVTLLVASNLALFISVSPVSAKQEKGGKWEEWEGTQYAMPVSVRIDKLKIAGRNVEIYGQITMLTYTGYDFGGIQVVYETIHYMKIYGLDDNALGLLKQALSQYDDPNGLFNEHPEIVGMLYSYPRSGWFTWHTGTGQVLGKGIFRSSEGVGRLWVSGPGIVVKGEFWIQVDSNGNPVSAPLPTPQGIVQLPLLYHQGSYIITSDGD